MLNSSHSIRLRVFTGTMKFIVHLSKILQTLIQSVLFIRLSILHHCASFSLRDVRRGNLRRRKIYYLENTSVTICQRYIHDMWKIKTNFPINYKVLREEKYMWFMLKKTILLYLSYAVAAICG